MDSRTHVSSFENIRNTEKLFKFLVCFSLEHLSCEGEREPFSIEELQKDVNATEVSIPENSLATLRTNADSRKEKKIVKKKTKNPVFDLKYKGYIMSPKDHPIKNYALDLNPFDFEHFVI